MEHFYLNIQISIKKITFFCTFLLLLFFTNQSYSQSSNNAIDSAGDIAFVAFHDNDDGFSFLFLDDCPNGTTIRFLDDGWTGSAFNSPTAEGEVLWTNNTGSTINKVIANITSENQDISHEKFKDLPYSGRQNTYIIT